MPRKITLEEVETNTSETMDISEVALFLGMDTQCMRSQAQEDSSKLGFPVIIVGRRIVVPRRGFLYFVKYGYGHERRGA